MPPAHPRAPARTALMTIVTAAAALGAACADNTPTLPRRPAPSLIAADAGADTTAAPVDTTLSRPGELDSLFGAAADSVYAAVLAHRASADRALDSLTAELLDRIDDGAADDVPDDSASAPGGNGVRETRASTRLVSRLTSGAAGAARAVDAPQVTTRDLVDVGGTAVVVEATTRVRPSADAGEGTLTLDRDETITVVPAGGRGAGVQEQMAVRVTLPYCPDPDGAVQATVFATARAWRAFDMPAHGAPPDSARWDRRRESALEGTITTRVNDDGEIDSHALTLASHVTSDLDATTRLQGGARFAAASLTPLGLGAPLASRPVVDPTGDYAALAQLGHDERLLYPYLRRDFARQIAAARALWQGGRCVEVTFKDALPATVDPGQRVDLWPVPKSKRDGAVVFPSKLLAFGTGASVSPLGPTASAYPAMFSFTMPEDPVSVETRVRSRRGNAVRAVDFAAHENRGGGFLVYNATTKYQYDKATAGGEVTARATGRTRIRSDLEFVFKERYHDGTEIYEVRSKNQIELDASASAQGSSRSGTSTAKESWTMSLGGRGTSQNPRGPNDPNVTAGYTVTAQGISAPGYAGMLEIKPVGRPGLGQQYIYSLELRVTQIAADYRWKKDGEYSCVPKAGWSFSESYDNASRQAVTTVSDPDNCQRYYTPGTITGRHPYTFGFLSADRTKPHPEVRRGGIARGIAVYKGPETTIEGLEAGTNEKCDEVLFLDPLALGHITSAKLSDWVGGYSWIRGGCHMQYSVQYVIPWPRPAS